MGQFILCIILLVVIAVQAIVIIVQRIVIYRLKRKFRRFKKEVDIERRVVYSHYD